MLTYGPSLGYVWDFRNRHRFSRARAGNFFDVAMALRNFLALTIRQRMVNVQGGPIYNGDGAEIRIPKMK
jgi:hypothetical protein